MIYLYTSKVDIFSDTHFFYHQEENVYFYVNVNNRNGNEKIVIYERITFTDGIPYFSEIKNIPKYKIPAKKDLCILNSTRDISYMPEYVEKLIFEKL
jgi:hypothetical protein